MPELYFTMWWRYRQQLSRGAYRHNLFNPLKTNWFCYNTHSHRAKPEYTRTKSNGLKVFFLKKNIYLIQQGFKSSKTLLKASCSYAVLRTRVYGIRLHMITQCADIKKQPTYRGYNKKIIPLLDYKLIYPVIPKSIFLFTSILTIDGSQFLFKVLTRGQEENLQIMRLHQL